MSIQFKIANLDRNTADGFVTTVHWTASKTQNGVSGGSYGAVSFTKKDGVNLVPYANLTESTVIEGVKEALGIQTLAAMEASYDAQIADKQAPTKATGKPW